MTIQEQFELVFAVIGVVFVIWHVFLPIKRSLKRKFNNWFYQRINDEKIYLSRSSYASETDSLCWHIKDFNRRLYCLEQKDIEKK